MRSRTQVRRLINSQTARCIILSDRGKEVSLQVRKKVVGEIPPASLHYVCPVLWKTRTAGGLKTAGVAMGLESGKGLV